jgi:hypothetical protein
VGVVEQLAINNIGEPSLEAAERFFLGVAFGPLAEIIRAAGGVPARLAGRHDMQRIVELPITSPREPMADDIAARGFNRRHSTVGREVRRTGEAVNVPDPAQNFGGEDRSDAEQLGESRVRCFDCRGDLLLARCDGHVELAHFPDEVPGE